VFGYITVNQDELKMKDVRRYKSYYCGLCHELGERHGNIGRLTLNYDMTFLAILLAALYETPMKTEKKRCVPHPFTKQEMLYGEYTGYTADMDMLLTWYKMADDVNDENSVKARAFMRTRKKDIEKLKAAYPRQSKAMEENFKKLSDAEFANIHDLDYVSGLFGGMIAEVFVPKQDEWADELYRMGFYLGKFIYLLDAYEDLEKDAKNGEYNPWENQKGRKDFEALVENTLTMMIAESAREFEKLPILEDVDILRNIMYSGVWSRYETVKKKREEGKK
jgi:hypothetical protein